MLLFLIYKSINFYVKYVCFFIENKYDMKSVEVFFNYCECLLKIRNRKINIFLMKLWLINFLKSFFDGKIK